MLTNKEFEDNDRDLMITCDVCSNQIAIFLKGKCTYKVLGNERMKVIYLTDGIYHCCNDECLQKWVRANVKKLDDNVNMEYPEDKYFKKNQIETDNLDTEEDVSLLDGVEQVEDF